MEHNFRPNAGRLEDVSRPLFYAFAFLTGVTMMVSPEMTGNMMGLTVLGAVSLVSAGFAEDFQNEWKWLLEMLSTVGILTSVLFTSYISVVLSF